MVMGKFTFTGSYVTMNLGGLVVLKERWHASLGS